MTSLGIACGARTELGAILPEDASTDNSKPDATDALADTTLDITPRDVATEVVFDVRDECTPDFEPCTSNSECCDFDCVIGVCGGPVPPYGGAPPP